MKFNVTMTQPILWVPISHQAINCSVHVFVLSLTLMNNQTLGVKYVRFYQSIFSDVTWILFIATRVTKCRAKGRDKRIFSRFHAMFNSLRKILVHQS